VKKFLFISAVLVVLAMVFVGCAKSDSAAIEDTTKGFFAAYNAQDYEKCLTYLPEVSETEQSALITGLQYARELSGEVTIESITDIKVNDSTATATLTGTVMGQTQTQEITLSKENGSWKMVWQTG